ncbi:SNF5-domain-containing protein [Panus rudis PR-1116 ss-1]|nr:SNF5-domain-containing protein [Panus rudis PR-1116 ss-1]
MNASQGQPNLFAGLHQGQQQQHQAQQFAAGLNPNQLQQMYQAQQAAKFGNQPPNGAAPGASHGFSPQQLMQQQSQNFNVPAAGVNPAALMNGRMGMAGMSPQQLQQMQRMQMAAGGGGMAPTLNPAQLLSQHQGMNGANSFPGSSMNGMGGGINPAALSAANVGGPTAGSPPIPSGSAGTPAPPGSHSSQNPHHPHPAHQGQSSIANLNLSQQQIQQLQQMPVPERQKIMSHLMAKHQQQQMYLMQQQAQANAMAGGGGQDGLHNVGPSASNMNMNMGMGGMGAGGQNPNMGMMSGNNMMGMNPNMGTNMGGYNNAMNMSGGGMNSMNMNQSAQLTDARMAQLQREQFQQQQHQAMAAAAAAGHHRPPSSAGHHQQHQQHGIPGSSQSHMQSPLSMMPPPSSIPPRPPTTAPRPSPSPRPGTAGSAHGFSQPHPQHHQQQGQSSQMPTAPSPRPGTAGASPSRMNVPGGRHTPGPGGAPSTPQGQPQQQQGQHSSPRGHMNNLPTPIPIQPRPPSMGMPGSSSSPGPRPGTSHSHHGMQQGQEQQRVPSRPQTAVPGSDQQQPSSSAPPQTNGTPAPPGSGMMSSLQQQTPGGGGYQPIAPAPSTPTSAGGNMGAGPKGRASGTPVPSTPQTPSNQYPPQHSQQQQQQQQQQGPRSASIPPNSAMISAGTPAPGPRPSSSSSGHGGMGMVGHGHPPNMNMNQMNNMNMRMGMPGMNMGMGGGMGMNMNVPNPNAMGMPGGGMMGPPILPRSQSQGPLPGGVDGMGMGMTMNGTNAPSPAGSATTGMSRQMSAGPEGMVLPPNAAGTGASTTPSRSSSVAPGQNAPGLSVNTNTNIPGGGPTSGPAQTMMPTSTTTSSSSPSVGFPGGAGPMSAGSVGAGGMNMGMMPPNASSSPASGMDIPASTMSMPMTPQQSRQASQPPPPVPPVPSVPQMTANSSPFPGVGMGVGTLDRKMSGVNGVGGPSASSATAVPVTGPGPAPTSSAPSGPPTIVYQLPPPPNVQLDGKVTRIQTIPLKDSDKFIPPLSSVEIAKVQEWMKTDKAYVETFKKMKERMTNEMREVFLKNRPWWEKDPQDDMRLANARRRGEKFTVTGLKTGKEDRRSKKTGRREGFKFSLSRRPRTIDPDDAKRREQLVPIRLEFDVEHQKYRDTFVWNLNDPVITPEVFAQSIVDDYGLASSYHAIITKSIQDQLSDYKAHSTTFGEDGTLTGPEEDIIENGKLDEEDAAFWEEWRKVVRSDAIYKQFGGVEERSRKRRKVVKDEVTESEVPKPAGEVPMSVDDFEEDESKMNEEMRILVKLDIIVGSVKLEDQFEWDLDNEDPSPERFAEVYAKDLGLGGEFKTAIAHSIREQVQTYQKSLFLVGHPSDGTVLQDDDLRMSLLPSLSTGARSMDQVGAFTPLLNYLSESEIERNEREREKELNRRRRKTTRGRRGVLLPDREPPKTYRTPAIGFPEIDPATLAIVNAANAVPTRRAAAAAASRTIADMVASENGNYVMPSAQTPLTPTVSTSSVPKQKKPKGHFQPPSYPSSVLRARASVKAPTPSTAADVSSLPPPLENDLPLPSSSGAAENRGARVVLPAKRVKELEREAKEKEYADGQHANYIDGVWHCSNCGCPENIAIGRRKGPLGDKSQCGTCGKFWHRHRRPRPVVYNSDPEYHLNLKREEEQAKVAASRRKRPHAAQTEAPTSKAATVEPETPAPKPESESKPKSEAPATPSKADHTADEIERATSPMSTVSSSSEPPLAQKMKSNGVSNGSKASLTDGHDTPGDRDRDGASQPADSTSSPDSPRPANSTRPQRAAPAIPTWLKTAMAQMQAKYPDDTFEVTLRRVATSSTPEWRIRCLDCPGKLYTPGPGETLDNYEIHLKNRQHRHKVNARISGS